MTRLLFRRLCPYFHFPMQGFGCRFPRICRLPGADDSGDSSDPRGSCWGAGPYVPLFPLCAASIQVPYGRGSRFQALKAIPTTTIFVAMSYDTTVKAEVHQAFVLEGDPSWLTPLMVSFFFLSNSLLMFNFTRTLINSPHSTFPCSKSTSIVSPIELLISFPM